MARGDEEFGTPFGGTMQPLHYSSLDYNTHPIDLIHYNPGFGPFNGPWSPWEFADPQSNIDCGYSGSNVHQFAPDSQSYQQLFTDPTTDRINQMLGAQAAAVHQQATGGWLHDLLGGIGEGVIGGGATGG